MPVDTLAGNDWTFSLRWYMSHETGEPLCVDEWESVGLDAGVFLKKFGGFIDSNCLMIDKIKCEPALCWWCFPLPEDPRAMSEDRMVFKHLKALHRGVGTGKATTYYTIHPDDGMYTKRLKWVRQKAVPPRSDESHG